MVLCGAWLLWGHLQSRSLYAMSLPVEDAGVLDWQKRHSLRRFVQVRRSDRISAPLTYGVLQPVVLLPSSMDLSDAETLSYVLEHEYVHIRRFDTLRKCLLAAGLCLHWFNPLVWGMYLLAVRDMELACDEAVVRAGADRRGYALALLRLEEERSGASLSGSHFSGHTLEKRIEAIMEHKKHSLSALLAVLVLMSVTTTVFATSAPERSWGGSHATTTVVEDILELSSVPDGERRFSDDNGKTWMSEDQYHAKYGGWGDAWEVEWWTYDAYREWLDQERLALDDMIGTRGYTSGKGWFVWDKKMVDKTIAMYERIARDIQNGGLYSKKVFAKDGSEIEDVSLGFSLMSGTAEPISVDSDSLSNREEPDGGVELPGPLTGIVVEGEAGSLIDCIVPRATHTAQTACEIPEDAAETDRTFSEIFANYAPWGLTYDESRENEYLLTLDGQPVQIFVDLQPDGGVFSYSNPYAETGLRVYTQYDNAGKLSGLTVE